MFNWFKKMKKRASDEVDARVKLSQVKNVQELEEEPIFNAILGKVKNCKEFHWEFNRTSLQSKSYTCTMTGGITLWVCHSVYITHGYPIKENIFATIFDNEGNEVAIRTERFKHKIYKEVLLRVEVEDSNIMKTITKNILGEE